MIKQVCRWFKVKSRKKKMTTKKRTRPPRMSKLQAAKLALRKGRNSASMPEYALMGMTADDDFAMNQRSLCLLSRTNLDVSNLPPPTKFCPSRNPQNRPTRAYSANSIHIDLHRSQLAGDYHSKAQVTQGRQTNSIHKALSRIKDAHSQNVSRGTWSEYEKVR